MNAGISDSLFYGNIESGIIAVSRQIVLLPDEKDRPKLRFQSLIMLTDIFISLLLR